MRRRLGFGTVANEGERVVVVQAGPLSAALPTTLVVPLDVARDAYAALPSVRVRATEAGAQADHVALPTLLRAVAIDSLAPGSVGRLGPATQLALDEMLRVVLDL